MKYLLLLLSFYSFSQNHFGHVDYKISFSYGDSKIDNKDAQSFVETAKNGSKNINFSLTFNDNYSLFKYNDKGIKNYEEEIALIFSGAEDICFTDKKNKINYIKISENQIFKKDEFIVIDSIKNNWLITKETKIIDKYTCYKATITLDKNKYQTKNNISVTAWFAPELPYSFGPNGFSGLPGLILELDIKKNIFIADKITFNENVDIEKPKKGKEINFIDYNKIILERTPSFKKLE